jgi:hypothetical protein
MTIPKNTILIGSDINGFASFIRTLIPVDALMQKSNTPVKPKTESIYLVNRFIDASLIFRRFLDFCEKMHVSIA